jgi:hypothetical protein
VSVAADRLVRKPRMKEAWPKGSTRLSAGTSSSSAATRIITRMRLSRHGPGVHSLTYRRYLWHPLHLKRDIHGGAVKTERISVHH